MRILQPVIWAKGTFLNPQHLQVQDRYVESILQFRMDALHFRPWGFSKLQIDREALAGGALAIHSASGLFPDGLPFEIPAADPAPPTKPLLEYFEPEQNSIDLYLAIPNYRDGGVNLSMPDRGLDTRYLAELTMMRDENTGAGEKPVQIARKNFRLLVEGEPARGSVTMKVARVNRTEAGLLELDPHFAPPLLDLSASEYLVTLTRRLVEILSAKSGQLAGMRRQKNQSLAEFTTADIANFWLLYTINSNLPQIRHVLETRRGHPEELFTHMSSLAASLTTFSLEIQPRDLPAYDHDDLGDCFSELDEKLRRLLETVVPSNFVSLPLKIIRPSIYAAPLFEDRFIENTKLYLAIKADMNEGELIQKVPYLVKMCSADHIDHLIRQALPGIELIHQPSPPSSIPIKLNFQYFMLSRSGVAWEAVTRARNIAAYVPGDFPEAEMELVVLLPEKK